MLEISAAEARFEAWRQRAGFLLALLIFIMLLIWPMPNLSPEAHKLAAVMGLVMCLWITEALPLAVTGLLGPTLVIPLGIAPAAKAFAPFADPIMFLFVGAFVLARAITICTDWIAASPTPCSRIVGWAKVRAAFCLLMAL